VCGREGGTWLAGLGYGIIIPYPGYIYIYIYMCVCVNVERKKNKMWPLCQEGPWAKGPLPSALGNYARQLWEKFSQLGCCQLCRA
jgi:hypothetical protein